MDWDSAHSLIKRNIVKGTDVNTSKSKFREITGVDSNGFKVRIGNKTHIYVSFNLLKDIYHASLKNDGIYNKTVLDSLKINVVKHHQCYVHAIGMIFKFSDVVEIRNGRTYSIIK